MLDPYMINCKILSVGALDDNSTSHFIVLREMYLSDRKLLDNVTLVTFTLDTFSTFTSATTMSSKPEAYPSHQSYTKETMTSMRGRCPTSLPYPKELFLSLTIPPSVTSM